MSEETKKVEEAEVVQQPVSEENQTEAPVKEEAPVSSEEATPVAETQDVPATEEAPVAEEAAAIEEVETTEEVEETVSEVEETPASIVEEVFNWETYEEGSSSMTAANRAEMEAMYENTLSSSVEHEVVKGVVVAMTDRECIIDINSKSEGVISLNEFRYNQDLKVGDEVEVLVDRQEDKNGQLVLSHRKARAIQAWDRVNSAFENEEIVNGYVKCRTKGGMIVDVFGLEAFLPGSQIDVKPIRDYDMYVDKTMEFKIVKINHEFKNVVVSHKALIEADLEEQKREIIGKLEKGQVLEGVVKNITSYGVFIDLGGVDGLIHITDLSWSRINHPSEVLDLDQKLNVVILDFDEGKTRIQLGLKQLEAHPWDALDANLQAGDKIKGKVVVIADYGAFVEVLPGVEGLIHVSEMSWSTHLRSAQDFVKVGEEVEAVILTLDREDRKMSLGIKQLTPDPWTDIVTKYPTSSQHTGTVRNFTNFGVFVELEEGIDGLIHISDLSWTKKVKHPSEFTSIGAKLEVIVLDIDVDNRRLSLGHKQTGENPWENYEAVFEVGSVHTGTVKDIFDRGANIYFDTFGIDGFAPTRHMVKSDNTPLKEGDTTEFKVIEFNMDAKRIVVSHTQINKDVAAQEKAEKSAEDARSNKTAQANMKKINSSSDRSTLGDIDALAQLKADMEKEEAKDNK
jgi:small subunit ribosomal protein S1